MGCFVGCCCCRGAVSTTSMLWLSMRTCWYTRECMKVIHSCSNSFDSCLEWLYLLVGLNNINIASLKFYPKPFCVSKHFLRDHQCNQEWELCDMASTNDWAHQNESPCFKLMMTIACKRRLVGKIPRKFQILMAFHQPCSAKLFHFLSIFSRKSAINPLLQCKLLFGWIAEKSWNLVCSLHHINHFSNWATLHHTQI